MNATNRGVNRVVLLIVGVALIGVGGGAAAAMVWPKAGDMWRSWLSQWVQWMVSANKSSLISQTTTVSWFIVALLTVLVLIVVIAVIVIARLGGGRTSVLIREEGGAGVQGPVRIRHEFASDAITETLTSHEDILSSKVNSRQIQGTNLLHVSVTPRQNVSPVQVAATLRELLDRLGTLLGRQIPTVVTIHSGIRSRLAANQSRVN